MCPVNAIRVAYTGELGWELHHPIEMQNYLFDRLMEAAGEPHGHEAGRRARAELAAPGEVLPRLRHRAGPRRDAAGGRTWPRFVDLSKDFHGKCGDGGAWASARAA